jgi:hypothetical protein
MSTKNIPSCLLSMTSLMEHVRILNTGLQKVSQTDPALQQHKAELADLSVCLSKLIQNDG